MLRRAWKDTGCVATLSECDFSDSAWYEDDEWWCGLAVEGGARATLSEVTLGGSPGSGTNRLRIHTDADSSTYGRRALRQFKDIFTPRVLQHARHTSCPLSASPPALNCLHLDGASELFHASRF